MIVQIAFVIVVLIALLLSVRGPIGILRARFAKLQPRPGEFEEQEIEPALLKVGAAVLAGALVVYLTYR